MRLEDLFYRVLLSQYDVLWLAMVLLEGCCGAGVVVAPDLFSISRVDFMPKNRMRVL